MRSSLKSMSAAAATGLLAALAGAVPAHAATTHTVAPGQSIQAAIDAAAAGDTIVVQQGLYHESLEIGPGKDGLTITGQGVTLEPPANANTLCQQMGDPAGGFCVHGAITPPANPSDPNSFPTVTSTLKNVTIQGFKIQHYPGIGIFGFGTEGLTVSHNLLFDDGEYGVFINTSTGGKVLNNFAVGSKEAGIYIGDSPNPPAGMPQLANATVTGNRTFDNLFGIFLRDAQQGTIANNNVMNNCIGILALADAPGPSGHWTIQANHVASNVKACPAIPDENFPAMSGIGVLLLGANDNTVSGNDVYYNIPGGDTQISGGIVVAKDPSNPNATAPMNNTITSNVAHGNKPADILWDGSGTGNTFTSNSCDVAVPSTIACS